MSLLPYGVRIIRGKTWFIRRKSEKGPDQRFDSNTRRKQIKILTQITKNIGIFSAKSVPISILFFVTSRIRPSVN